MLSHDKRRCNVGIGELLQQVRQYYVDRDVIASMIWKVRMFSVAFFAILLAFSVSAAVRIGTSAWRIGIPACDDILSKYKTCLRSHPDMLPAKWSVYKREFGQRVKGYAAVLARDTKAQAIVEKACKVQQDALNEYGGNADCFISPLALFDFALLEQRKEPTEPGPHLRDPDGNKIE
jgi:hypothetical protein